MKGFYEKDKATPVDPRFLPVFNDAKLASFPEGYRYLAYGQSSAYKIKMDLPQSRGQAHDDFYQAFIDVRVFLPDRRPDDSLMILNPVAQW